MPYEVVWHDMLKKIYLNILCESCFLYSFSSLHKPSKINLYTTQKLNWQRMSKVDIIILIKNNNK